MDAPTVRELSDTCQIAEQPIGGTIMLKRHQLALLHMCLKFEHERIPIPYNNTDHVDNYLRTQIGIIGDKVGSGKSYVILSLVLDKRPIEPEAVIKTFGYNKVVLSHIETLRYVKTNLLVIPHNLRSQWTEYIETFCKDSIKYCVVSKSKHLEQLQNDDLATYDLVVVTCTFHNRICHMINHRKYKLRRVFYDEVDNMLISGCEKVDTCFYWFVTASFNNLLYPRGQSLWDPNMQRYVNNFVAGLRLTGYVKNLFMDLSNAEKPYAKLLIVKNNDDFIDQSFLLPDIIHNCIRCATPRAINILHGIVDRSIIECLNAGDTEGAINHVSSSQRNTEMNIIELIISKYNNYLVNYRARIDFTNNCHYENEYDRQQELARCNKRITEIESKINNIKSRIETTDTCCICYDDIQNKTILSCCSNAYCFKCINVWLSNNSVCPLCKQRIISNDIYVVDSGQQSVQQDDKDVLPPKNVPNDKKDKIENLESILDMITDFSTGNIDPSKKILIFSSYESTFTYVINNLLDRLQIKYASLKGNSYHIDNIVKNYKQGDIQVLLINTKSYGSGLNLENTTDIIMFHKLDNEIEKQVIGRAQRMGRTNQLNVWYLLYENEIRT